MQVGERGEGLSGGQRQAIAIARAYLSRPSLLLFDEPSNAMDNRSEEQFKAHLTAEVRGRTLVLVTHRASLLSLVDRVIVLEAGRVAADGPARLRARGTGRRENRCRIPLTRRSRCSMATANTSRTRASRRCRARDRRRIGSCGDPRACVRAAAIVWASLATLDEVTVGAGAGDSFGQGQIVQNLEGGIVSEILVEPGAGGAARTSTDAHRSTSGSRRRTWRATRRDCGACAARIARLSAEADLKPFTAACRPGRRSKPELVRQERMSTNRGTATSQAGLEVLRAGGAAR
jgi:hypothetical protein